MFLINPGDSEMVLRERYSRFVVAQRRNLLNCPSMNILIENPDTLEYLNEAGKWTKNPVEGKFFGATETAFRVARREAIGRFSIVCHIPQTNQFINLKHGRGQGSSGSGEANLISGETSPD